MPGLGDVRGEIETGIGHGFVEQLLHQPVVAFGRHGFVARVADAEDVEHEVVGPRVDVGAEHVDARGKKRAADAADESRIVPATDEDFAVSQPRMVHPFDDGAERAAVLLGLLPVKLPESAEVSGDFRSGVGAEVTFGHLHEVRVEFLAVVGGKFRADFLLQVLEVDAALFEILRTLVEISAGRAVELPDKSLFPVGPVRVARALSVGQRDEHERVEECRFPHDFAEMRDGGGVFDVAGLRGLGEQPVVVDEGDELALLGGGQLQAASDRRRHGRAGVFMVPAVLGLAGVVEQQREIERGRVVVLLEKVAVTAEFRIFRGDEFIEFVDADQGVLVGGVAVEELVLHEAGEASEFG